jgi:GNAT superfamily N-acetyltransferase
MTTVVPAERTLLARVLDADCEVGRAGLSRHAYGRLDAAQMKTAWARVHQQRLALVEGTELLASATRYRMAGVLDQRPVRICGIGAVCTDPLHRGNGHAQALVEHMLDEAAQDGADLALLFSPMDPAWCEQNGLESMPATDVEISVAQSARHGAPMTLVRSGEERDLAAIVEMGRARAAPFRFHLDRDFDFVKHAITRKRLLAGFGSSDAHQLQFFIAEEGITAAAYVVVTVVGSTWTIEECGDRDVSGARVGAILQALLAREPAESRPTIRGWLPPGFVPPQVLIVSAMPSSERVMIRSLKSTVAGPQLSGHDVLYWRGDIF